MGSNIVFRQSTRKIKIPDCENFSMKVNFKSTKGKVIMRSERQVVEFSPGYMCNILEISLSPYIIKSFEILPFGNFVSVSYTLLK